MENASGDLAPSRGQQPAAITLEYKGIFLAHPGKRRILKRIMAERVGFDISPYIIELIIIIACRLAKCPHLCPQIFWTPTEANG